MKDRFVLDSNVWIEIERGNARVVERVEPLIQTNQICLVDLIVAELLRGTRSQRDFNRLKQGFASFPVISTQWERVAELAFRVGRQGYHPPLTDLYIAQAVLETHRTLITLDSDFAQIAKVKPFSLEMLTQLEQLAA